jgi:hypothetical protein
MLGLEASPSARIRTAAPGEAADGSRTCAAVKREAEEDLGQAFGVCDGFDSNPHRTIILLAGSRSAERKA